MMVVVIFKGREGEHVTGIPARDLTAEEWERMTKAQQQTALRCGLYEKTAEKKQTPAQKGAQKRKRTVTDGR